MTTTPLSPPRILLDMDDVLVLSEQFNSYQVRMAFRENDFSWRELWEGLVDAGARENLQALHKACAPRYAVSSSWAQFLTQAQFQQLCGLTGLDFVANALAQPWCTPQAPGSPRLFDVETYFRDLAQPHQGAILLLDDPESGWSLAESRFDQAGQLVMCSLGEGFTAQKLAEALNSLAKQGVPL